MYASMMFLFIISVLRHGFRFVFEIDFVSGPVQYQFTKATQAEFVFCEQTISVTHFSFLRVAEKSC